MCNLDQWDVPLSYPPKIPWHWHHWHIPTQRCRTSSSPMRSKASWVRRCTWPKRRLAWSSQLSSVESSTTKLGKYLGNAWEMLGKCLDLESDGEKNGEMHFKHVGRDGHAWLRENGWRMVDISEKKLRKHHCRVGKAWRTLGLNG